MLIPQKQHQQKIEYWIVLKMIERLEMDLTGGGTNLISDVEIYIKC